MTIKSALLFAKSLIFPKAEKRSSARRSFFGALLCIALSVIPLIVVVSITTGMINGMTERIIGLSSSHIGAYIASNYDAVQTPESFMELSKELKSIDGVINAYPEIQASSLALNKNIRTGISIRAVQKDIFRVNKSFNKLFEVTEGSLEDYETAGGKSAVLGQKIAETLGLHAGDSFRIITTKNVEGKLIPKLTTFKVCAIVTSGYQELDQLWCFIPLETAYTFLNFNNVTCSVACETNDAFSPNLVRTQVKVKEYFNRWANVYRWDQIHASEFENFSSTKVMLVFVMMLIVLVASINIASAIVMLVMERKKEIAILKSIGATPKGITFSFLLTGVACGGGGLLLGVPAGILISVFANQLVTGLEKLLNFIVRINYSLRGIELSAENYVKLMDPAYYLQNIPVTIPAGQIILICVLTITLSLIVSIIPSVKAGKEKPLDILRKN